MRVSENTLNILIKNNGLINGINPPSIDGIVRLALDLKEAREENKKLLAMVKKLKG